MFALARRVGDLRSRCVRGRRPAHSSGQGRGRAVARSRDLVTCLTEGLNVRACPACRRPAVDVRAGSETRAQQRQGRGRAVARSPDLVTCLTEGLNGRACPACRRPAVTVGAGSETRAQRAWGLRPQTPVRVIRDQRTECQRARTTGTTQTATTTNETKCCCAESATRR